MSATNVPKLPYLIAIVYLSTFVRYSDFFTLVWSYNFFSNCVVQESRLPNITFLVYFPFVLTALLIDAKKVPLQGIVLKIKNIDKMW